MAKPRITRSDTFFYSKIVEKYRTGKKGRFRFPVMILRKNAGYSLPQKINLNVLVQLHFHNAISSFGTGGVRCIKEVLRNKEITQILKNVHGERIMVLMKQYFPEFYPKVSLLNSGAFIYPLTSNQYSSINGIQIRPRTQGIYAFHGETVERTSSQKTVSWAVHSVFEHESPATLIRSDLYQNNLSVYTLHPKSVYNISNAGMADRFLNHVNCLQVNNPRVHRGGSDRKEDAGQRSYSQKGSTLTVRSVFEHKSPAILVRNDLYQNNTSVYTSHPESVYNISNGGMVNRFLNRINYLQVSDTQFINLQLHGKGDRNRYTDKLPYSQKTVSWVVHPIFEHKSPATLIRSDLYQNSVSGYNVSGRTLHSKSVYNVRIPQLINPQSRRGDRDRHTGEHTPSQKTDSRVVHQVFEPKSPAMSVRNDLYRNNISGFNQVNYLQVNNPRYENKNPAIMVKMFPGQSNMQITSLQMLYRNDIKLTGMTPVIITQTGIPLLKHADHIQNIHLQILKNTASSANAFQNYPTFFKPYIKNIKYVLPPDTPDVPFRRGRASLVIKNKNFIFHETRKIEQEVDELKKIVIETKKTLTEKTSAHPSDNGVKPNIDVNRIADQVYQNIERRIRIERERRGM